MSLGDTFGDQSDGLDLGESENVEGRRVDGSTRGEVDDDVGIGVLLDGILDRGVDGEKSLLGTPVELLDVVTAEWVDHGGDGWSLAAA